MARVVHVNREAFDLYIGRAMPERGYPKGSKWANPFRLPPGYAGFHRPAQAAAAEALLNRYRSHVLSTPKLMAALHELAGKTLGCWCKPGPCHGDVLVELLHNHGIDAATPPPQLGLFPSAGKVR